MEGGPEVKSGAVSLVVSASKKLESKQNPFTSLCTENPTTLLQNLNFLENLLRQILRLASWPLLARVDGL